MMQEPLVERSMVAMSTIMAMVVIMGTVAMEEIMMARSKNMAMMVIRMMTPLRPYRNSTGKRLSRRQLTARSKSHITGFPHSRHSEGIGCSCRSDEFQVCVAITLLATK